jgi:hypothetical protein
MLLCKVYNLTTGNRFEFQAADQAAIDAKLASEPCYGRDAWTETIPAWTQTGVWSTDELPVFDPEAIIEHPEHTVDHPSEFTVEVIDLAPQEQAAARAAAIGAVQSRLDTLAQSWGYDGIVSLCTYASSKVARFAAEGQAGVDWRDATWAAVDQHQADVTSADELFALLPAMPERPTHG